MARYASGTTVSSERSRAEIEAILRRYGADQFISGWESNRAVIGFRAQGRTIKFILTLPDRGDSQFRYTEKRQYARSPEETTRAWEQAVRQRWRALCLCIKAKLESVEAGIETFEEAFMPHIVLPTGETVSHWLTPQLEVAYQSGQAPKLLPFAASG